MYEKNPTEDTKRSLSKMSKTSNQKENKSKSKSKSKSKAKNMSK